MFRFPFAVVFWTVLLAIAGCRATATPPAATPLTAPLAIAAGPSTTSLRWSDDDSPVSVTMDDPAQGSRSAPVTIVQFTDMQCPFCARVQQTLQQIGREYGPSKVRWVWKNQPLPFHNNARPAANAAMGVFELAGPDAFFRFTGAAFDHQQDLSLDSYLRWAAEAGVKDIEQLRRGLDEDRWDGKVARDIEQAQKVGALGTPAFFVNGVKISGAQPFEQFKEIIDAELTKAQAAMAAGTRPDRVYVEMAKKNFAAPPPTNPSDDSDAPDTSVWQVSVGTSPVHGPDTALVTIIEFSDFQCPFCARVQDTLKKVQTKYGNNVRIVWKNNPLPFHPRAEPAAQLAMFAHKKKGNVGFWAVHDKLFDSQPKLEDADLENVAKSAGLGVAEARKAIASHQFKAQIDEDVGLADDVQANGTPHFFINGRRLTGAQPIEKFQAVIDEELAKARARIAKGVSPKNVYADIMKDARAAPLPEMKTVPLPARAMPEKGAPRAPVVIQEFSDFQCAFCARVQPTLAQIIETYGTRVKIVFRHKPLPMHQDAALASEAAVEAFRQKGSRGFWQMHDLMFQNQSTVDGLKTAALEQYAATVGLDVAAFRSALAQHAHQHTVEDDSKACDDAGIGGTPAFVINGYFVSGAQPFAKFKKVIDRALADAKKK